MPTYVLRNLEPGQWSQFRDRAFREGWHLRAIFLQLMADYANGRITPSKKPDPDRPENSVRDS